MKHSVCERTFLRQYIYYIIFIDENITENLSAFIGKKMYQNNT